MPLTQEGGDFPGDQRLGLRASHAGGTGSIPRWGTRSHMLQGMVPPPKIGLVKYMYLKNEEKKNKYS